MFLALWASSLSRNSTLLLLHKGSHGKYINIKEGLGSNKNLFVKTGLDLRHGPQFVNSWPREWSHTRGPRVGFCCWEVTYSAAAVPNQRW